MPQPKAKLETTKQPSMPKSTKPTRENKGNAVFNPNTTKETKVIVADGKRMVVSKTTRAGGKGSMRMKGKVVHKGAAAEIKKLEVATKNLKAQPILAIDTCELIRKDEQGYHITTWKTPKILGIHEGGVFFVSGANKAETVSEEEYTARAKSQFDELTSKLQGLGEEPAEAKGEEAVGEVPVEEAAAAEAPATEAPAEAPAETPAQAAD